MSDFMTLATELLPLQHYAVVVNPADNVAVAKRAIARGTSVLLDGQTITLSGDVASGHRFATKDIAPGVWARQYNQPFGKSLGILVGDPINNDNLDSTVPHVDPRDLTLKTPTFDYVPA